MTWSELLGPACCRGTWGVLACVLLGSVGCSENSAGDASPIVAEQDGTGAVMLPPTGTGAVPESTGGTVSVATGGDELPVGGEPPEVVSTGGADAGTMDPTNAFCAVREVVGRQCVACHGDPLTGGAPMPLLTHADFLAPAPSDAARSVYSLIGERIHATTGVMPPPPRVMDDADKATLDAWLASGALPPADPTCPGVELPPDDEGPQPWPEGCDESNIYRIVTSAANDPSAPYVVPGNSESHPQFYFDAPWGDDPVQMVAYRPIVGEGNVAHHWILYANSGGLFGGQFLISWSPGKDEDHGIPDNVGIYFPSGRDSLRLDMHYYNLGRSEDVPDQTGLDVCVTRDFKEHSATVYSLSASATAPARSRVDNSRSCTVRTTPGADVHLISVSPHMHGLGVNGKLELTRDGVTTTLHDQPFDFDDQTIWTLNDLPIQDGDVLTTTCTYQNDTAQTVTFGPDTSDEMCFNFVMYYPKDAFSCR